MKVARVLPGLPVVLAVAAMIGLSVPAAYALSANGTATSTVAVMAPQDGHRIPVSCPGCPSP